MIKSFLIIDHDTDKLDEQLYPLLNAFTELALISYYQFKYIRIVIK